MIFKNTTIWKAAFEEAREDATKEEQERLALVYESMRSRASILVSRIAIDLPQMTVHDVTHLDALWEMASIATGRNFSLNPAEAFVFGGAVLLHDSAMCIAAYPGRLSDLRQTIEWRDLHARYSALSGLTSIEAERNATESALRVLHAKQAEIIPKISWKGPHGQDMYIIENQQIRNFYGPKIGKIAYSHWWSISKVEEELSGFLGALPDVTNCTVDLLKVACLLRVADAMHLDQRRAPAFELALTQPTGESSHHWQFQGRMAKPFVQGDALVYTAQPPFEVEASEAWWIAFDALQMVDGELRSVDRVLRDRQKAPFLVRRVNGAYSPSDLSRTVETVGWTPVDSTIRVTDVPKIVATLGGSKLYGSDLTAPVRELLQNALDAITARRRLQARPGKWGEIQVILEKRQDTYWLCIEDNGVGMSTAILTGPLIDFGNSFWRSSLAVAEFPGLLAAGMKARGKYGIGFFSIFMLGDYVRVISRRYDRDVSSARVLEFRNGLSSRPNLLEASSEEVPLDGGTRVEVKLRVNPRETDGLLYVQTLGARYVESFVKFVESIAPASDTTIMIRDDNEISGCIEAGDWLDLDTSVFLSRIITRRRPLAKMKPGRKLSILRDEEGRIFGRACIDTEEFWSTSGLMTVDGLAADRIVYLSGILFGEETTASRNSARPIVPAPVLAAWASEQAIELAASDISDREKAIAAVIVTACGGDPAQLPVIFFQEEWMGPKDFLARISEIEHIRIYSGNVIYDEDDGVTKRDFESSFEENYEIARTVDIEKISAAYWILSITKGSGLAPFRMIESILTIAWGSWTSEKEEGSIGEVNGVEICRTLLVYTRIYDDKSPEDLF